jgi:hypothetical protein
MTLVVTHTQGFLGCFTKEPDGTLKQRALIDTGQEAPTPLDLANMGETMARDYKWLNQLPEAAKPKPLPPKPSKAIPAPKHKFSAPGQSPDGMTVSERKNYILAVLRHHPDGMTTTQLVTGKGLDFREASGRWHHQLKDLERAGLIVGRPMKEGIRRGSGNPIQWFAVQQGGSDEN